MDNFLALGVDIGGTKIAYALINRNGETVATHRLPTNAVQGESSLLDQIAQGIDHIIKAEGLPIQGIGVGSPGHVDSRTGVVRNAVNLRWSEVALCDELRNRLSRYSLDVPIFVEKDANAAALGEMYFGAARGVKDFVLLAIGTGLGAGAVVNGELLVGANSYATELGHFSVNPDGRQCNCGLKGCPEIYVSGVGLLAGYQAHKDQFPQSILTQGNAPVDTAAILAAARANDPLATAIINDAIRALSDVMVFSAATTNPALFIIGGGLGHAASDLLNEPALASFRTRTLAATHANVTVVKSQVTSSAVGAACLVWHELRDKIAVK